MLRKISFTLFCAAILYMVASTVTAQTIVDTGEPVYHSSGGMVLNSEVYRAGEFDLASATTLSSIQGWLGNYQGGSGYGLGPLTIAIYDDGGDLPGHEIYSKSVFVPNTDDNAWRGVAGLSWLMQPGEYWVSFEVRAAEGQYFNGYMQYYDIPVPLTNYAAYDNFFLSSNHGWLDDGATKFAVRIEGDVTAVPLPGAFLLFGSAVPLICAFRFRQMRKNQANG